MAIWKNPFSQNSAEPSTLNYPALDFTIEPGSDGYISEDSLDLILTLCKEGLDSQIEGIKQMTARCGSILAQSISLTSASLGAAYLGLSETNYSKKSEHTWFYGPWPQRRFFGLYRRYSRQ